jgi:hypothetical protein
VTTRMGKGDGTMHATRKGDGDDALDNKDMGTGTMHWTTRIWGQGWDDDGDGDNTHNNEEDEDGDGDGAMTTGMAMGTGRMVLPSCRLPFPSSSPLSHPIPSPCNYHFFYVFNLYF